MLGPRLHAGDRNEQGDLDDLLVERGPEPAPLTVFRRPCDHLAELATTLAEVEAVVRGEHDRGLVEQAHRVDSVEQTADPAIDHRHLALVGGGGLGEVVVREAVLRSCRTPA